MKDKTTEPTSNEFGQLVAYMAQNGMTLKAAEDVIGNSPAGRTRQQITEELRTWLRTKETP